MAAGNWTAYTAAENKTYSALINWTSSNIRCVLLTNSYTPAPNTDSQWSNISAYECTGTGYTSGGQSVATPAVSTGGGTVTMSCASIPQWTAITVSARYAALVLSSGGASPATTDPILGYLDLNTAGSAIATAGGNLSIAPYSFAQTHTP